MSLTQVNPVDKKVKPTKLEIFANATGILSNLASAGKELGFLKLLGKGKS